VSRVNTLPRERTLAPIRLDLSSEVAASHKRHFLGYLLALVVVNAAINILRRDISRILDETSRVDSTLVVHRFHVTSMTSILTLIPARLTGKWVNLCVTAPRNSHFSRASTWKSSVKRNFTRDYLRDARSLLPAINCMRLSFPSGINNAGIFEREILRQSAFCIPRIRRT